MGQEATGKGSVRLPFSNSTSAPLLAVYCSHLHDHIHECVKSVSRVLYAGNLQVSLLRRAVS